MDFKLEPLPFEADALAPFLNVETVTIHHEKHHGGYVQKLDKALTDSETRAQTLTDIMLSSEGKIFNLAAQIWNHNFYWQSLSPEAHQPSDGTLTTLLEESFGGMEGFKEQFADAAANEFGSGWAWLVLDPGGQKLKVESTTDAVNPLVDGNLPILTLDVWEHAYYLDYQNDRAAYIRAFLDAHVNWTFAEANLNEATKRVPL